MRPDSRKSPDGTHSRSGYNGINGFWDPETNMPCHHPIWHRLFAINVNTGDLAWRPSSGGSLATHGGLVFIGAGEDSRFRAFDSKTGKQVWTVQIDAPAHLAPITFQGKDGTGGGFLGERTSRDAVMAFAVPERHELGECGTPTIFQDVQRLRNGGFSDCSGAEGPPGKGGAAGGEGSDVSAEDLRKLSRDGYHNG